MERGWRQNVDDVGRRGGHLLQHLEHRWNIELRRDLLRPLLVGIDDADYVHVVEALQGAQVIRAHIACADYPGSNPAPIGRS